MDSCYYHQSTKSTSSCERCNRPICSDCGVSFQNRIKYVDRDEIQRGRELDPDYEYDRLEDLKWCLPCYYAHYSNELQAKNNFSALLFDSFLDVIVSGLILATGLIILSFIIHINVPIEVILSPSILLGILVSTIIGSLFIYHNKRKDLDSKLIQIAEIKDRFLSITNIGTMDLPIACYYCKHEIDPEALACLNLDCTLGEKYSRTGKEVEVEPVNSNYGLFDTLRELPKYPDEDE